MQTYDYRGYRIEPPASIKTLEEYLLLEKELAQLLCRGEVHYWGKDEMGCWVQTHGEQQTFPKWMRLNEAAMELILEHDVWAVPYPIEQGNCFEGKFFHDGRFHPVYVPYTEHQTKALAYRYAIVSATIAKLKKTYGNVS